MKTYKIIIERREVRSGTVEIEAPNVTQAKRLARIKAEHSALILHEPVLSLNFVAVDSWECEA